MVEVSARAPGLDEFQALRRAAGMDLFPDETVQRSLDRTLHGVWLRDESDRLVGMGRVTGDGGCFAQINDIAVHPDFQRRGLGARIMQALVAWCDAELPSGSYLSLIADAGAERLYEKFGFEMRVGMARSVP